MKVAFVGKGGSGKTTLAGLFARHLAAGGAPVLALDADINQHLAAALGATDDEAVLLPALGDHLGEIKEYLRGDNPRISSAAAMVKTTPPGRGSRLIGIDRPNPLYDALVRDVRGVRLAVTGPFASEDLGVACYHSKVGAVELLLNHLADGPGEYAVVDMTAGADSFASGLFTRFDLTFLVCEPTVRSVGVYRQYTGYARDFGVRVAVIGNKVDDESDVDFLRAEVGDDLVGWVGRSAFVKAAERGRFQPIEALEPANRAVLDDMRARVDACGKDWTTYARQAAEFHRRNAAAWASERVGADLTEQIDPDFIINPSAIDVALRS
ncbi:ATP-binding protein [Catenuloplanes atrovinosus]|uniref:CO dehydrogenase maturation factor n=1 Tax=Catenuloplanes atrovinosus TaxID=137266 RepID=A0AAE4CCS1_9ACTN|nr:ATP-binding protein [Catenuloplanes atrovinosus]MDR7278309.1 CO dehydrogenase maturation factor [Catenuloplanes atrovinosus]